MSDGRPHANAPRNQRRAKPATQPEAAPKAAVVPRATGNRRSSVPEPEAPPRVGLVRRLVERLRNRPERAPRDWSRARRVATNVGKMLVVALVLVGAGAAGRLVERYVRTSPAFAIRTIRVEGSERLNREEILRASGVTLGRNVFEMPPEDIRARLERHPWIADATVRRRLPGTLEIDVRERRAAAVLVVDRTYLVGEDATVFKSLDAGEPSDLPVITLGETDRWLTDRAAFGTLLLDVVSLLHDYRRIGLESRGTIQEVHVGNDDGVTLYVGDSATEVRLGRAPFERKLRRLRLLLDEIRRRDAEPAYVLLDHERRPDRAVVRLRETLVPLPPMESEAPTPVEQAAPRRAREPRRGVGARARRPA